MAAENNNEKHQAGESQIVIVIGKIMERFCNLGKPVRKLAILPQGITTNNGKIGIL